MTKRVRAAGVFAGLALLIAAAVGVPGTSSLAAPSQAELEAAQSRLHELEAEFETVVEKYNAVNERLTTLQSQIGAAESKITDLSKAMSVKEDAAVEVAAELYKGGAAGGLEAVLASRSLADIEQRIEYLESSEQANAEVFAQLAVDKEELQVVVEQLEKDRAAAAQAKAQLADLRENIEAKVAEQADEISELRRQIEAAERRAEARRRAAAEAAAEQEAAAAGPTASSPVPAPPPAPTVTSASPSAATAARAALSQVGKPYQWGGAGPNSYDCSGLTMWAWAQAGVALPHNSSMQYSSTRHVSSSSLQPGDLLFYGSPIHHVGMYVGSGQMVEAPYSGASVRVTSWQRSDFVGASRPGV